MGTSDVRAAGVAWSRHPLVARGNPEPEFVRARELRRRHDIPLTAVAALMTELCGRNVAFSRLSDWERGLTRPRRSLSGQAQHRAWRSAMLSLLSAAIIDELEEFRRDPDRKTFPYIFTEMEQTVLRASPCSRTHIYLIELNDSSANSYTDVETARSMFLAIPEQWQPRWLACHEDGSECQLEAAFQTALSVKEVFIKSGEDPSNPDLRRGQLLGVFVVLCANLLSKQFDNDLSDHLPAVRVFVLKELPRRNPGLFMGLMTWLEAIDKSVDGGFPEEFPVGSITSSSHPELAREAVLGLLLGRQ